MNHIDETFFAVGARNKATGDILWIGKRDGRVRGDWRTYANHWHAAQLTLPKAKSVIKTAISLDWLRPTHAFEVVSVTRVTKADKVFPLSPLEQLAKVAD